MDGISLVMATYGEGKLPLIVKFLQSLVPGKLPVEVLIVDQNNNDIITKELNNFSSSDFNIRILKSAKGLSVSRNVGLRSAKYSIVAFPDDDCCYLPDTLSNVEEAFDLCNSGIILGTVWSLDNTYSLGYTKRTEMGMLGRKEVFSNACSISIFVKNPSWYFDVNFGLGSRYNSSEDYDYVLTGMKLGYKVFFDNRVRILHPDNMRIEGEELVRKVKSHSIGHGALYAKHFGLTNSTVLLIVSQFVRALQFLSETEKRRTYYLSGLYRLIGFYRYNNEENN